MLFAGEVLYMKTLFNPHDSKKNSNFSILKIRRLKLRGVIMQLGQGHPVGRLTD